MFWGDGVDVVRRVWEFVQPLRCEDPWYNSMLVLCREGRLDMDTYSFLHGFPTSTPGSWDTAMRKTHCQSGEDVRLVTKTAEVWFKTSWANRFLKGPQSHVPM